MDAEIWVAIAFVLFIGLLIYLGLPKKIGSALDSRADKIKKDLDEARRLKEEALALLADYQRKWHEAENEAKSIIAEATAEAERLATEAKAKAEEFVARRTKMAEAKIAQAEAQAVADVRGIAAEVAAAAAGKILGNQAKGPVAEDLIAKGVEDVRSKLN